MIQDKQSVTTGGLILRAFSLIGHSSNMVFVGIYSTETYEPLALADREQVQISPTMAGEDQTRRLAVEIHPRQIQAITRHIRTPDNVLTQINIANLHFVCLRNGTGCLTGMSNFNMDTKRDSIKEIDRTLFSIAKEHYTSQEFLGGIHALQISAILKENFIIVGLCRAGTESSLKILKNVFDEPAKLNTPNTEAIPAKPTENADSMKNAGEIESVNKTSECGLSEHLSTTQNMEHGNYNVEPLDASEVDLRPSTHSDEERRRYQLRRETSFCEDWRTATVRSIEALKMIGPFTEDGDDRRPLIANIESIDSSADTPGRRDSTPRNSQGDPNSKDTHVSRRPSRATMV